MTNVKLNFFRLHADILLLVVICLMVFASGFFPKSWGADVYLVFYALLYMITAIQLDAGNAKTIYWALALVLTLSAARMWQFPVLLALTQALNFVFFGYVVVSLIRQIAGAGTVTKRVILQAINGYMLLGIVFTFLIALMAQYDNSAFNFSPDATYGPNDVMYYVFVTFATLGYGDLLPVKPYAKSLAILISVSGQLYIAIIIALLVGKFSSRSHD